MKIAITGHRKGIGKAFAEQLSARGHTIVGISRSDGENIRRTAHTATHERGTSHLEHINQTV